MGCIISNTNKAEGLPYKVETKQSVAIHQAKVVSKEELVLEEDDYVREQKIIHSQQLFKIQGEKLKKLLHRSIGAITSLNKKKQLEIGSAFIISKNLILTSAHNVYNKELGCQNQSFKFYLEKDGFGKDYYEVQAVRYPQQFKTCSKSNKLSFDFALLKLEKQVVEFGEFLQLSLPCEICLMSNKKIYLDIFGYPIYKANFEYLDQRGIQFKLSQYGLSRENRITILDPSQKKICYAISTLPGQSGCPIVVGQNVIAIHNGGGKKKEQFNVARLIDIPMLSTLEGWEQQLKADYFRINNKDLCSHTQPIVKQYLKNKQRKIDLSSKGLREIDISEKRYLLQLNLSYNKLSAIDVTKNINLTQLYLSYNKLSAIDVTKNINLTQLYLSYNKLSAIDVTKNINLTQLYLSYNKLSAIDVTKNINLTQLYLSYNKLSAIDVTKNINLTQLNLCNNKLSAIDVTKNINLNQLNLCVNKLSAIDVTKNINLTELYLSQNQLSAIDVTKNINLTELYLSQNQLSAIDVTKNINLTELYLSQNQLSAIDVTKNINLTELYLSQNQLSAIDVTKNINLTELYLSQNQLSAIDVTKNINLTQLDLRQNQISEIFLSFSSKLKQLNFDHQNSANCKVQIFYNQIESNACIEWKEEQTEKYRKGDKQTNEHGCNYVFTAAKRG